MDAKDTQRTTVTMAALAILAVLAAACTDVGITNVGSTDAGGATQASAGSTPDSSLATSEPSSPQSPTDLVGRWRVEVPGEPEPEWLKLDQNRLSLIRDCFVMLGSWSAGTEVFVGSLGAAHSDGEARECDPPEIDTPWLDTATAYAVTEDGVDLLDSSGVVVATLTPGMPDDGPKAFLTAPHVGDVARIFASAPLPNGLSAAKAEDLLGRWAPVGEKLPGDPSVEFARDGVLIAFDGCNRENFRWIVGEEGEFARTSQVVNIGVGCDHAPAPDWTEQATRAGMDGDELVLIDPEGSEVVRLVGSE